MIVANPATKKRIGGGYPIIVSTRFRENKSTDFKATRVSEMERLFVGPAAPGKTKSTDTRSMSPGVDGLAVGRSDGRAAAIWKKVFRNPLPRMASIKKGEGENDRAFHLGRTEPIPAV